MANAVLHLERQEPRAKIQQIKIDVRKIYNSLHKTNRLKAILRTSASRVIPVGPSVCEPPAIIITGVRPKDERALASESRCR